MTRWYSICIFVFSSKWFYHFRFLPAMYEYSSSSTSLPIFDMVNIYNFKHSIDTSYVVVSHCGFDLPFSMINDTEHLLRPLIFPHTDAVLINICQIIGWPKHSFRIFHNTIWKDATENIRKILWKILNKIFCVPNTWGAHLQIYTFFSLCKSLFYRTQFSKF